MRWSVWLCMGSALCACGRSDHLGRGKLGSVDLEGAAGKAFGGAMSSLAGSGGAAGRVDTGGSAALSSGGNAGSAQAGSSASGGGAGTSASGGAGGSGGSGGSTGGAAGVATAGTGGSSAQSCDDTSEGGEGGASALECGEYIGCGCGCCRPQQFLLQSTCYYPERGERLAEVKCKDQLEAQEPMCKNAPCSSGYRHICCTTPEAVEGSFNAYGYADTVTLIRTFAGRETRAFVSEGTVEPRWPISAPSGWYFQGTDELSGPPDPDERYEIGGLGSLEFGEACTVTFDFTLFFATERGPVEPMRFKGTSVTIESADGFCATAP